MSSGMTVIKCNGGHCQGCFSWAASAYYVQVHGKKMTKPMLSKRRADTPDTAPDTASNARPNVGRNAGQNATLNKAVGKARGRKVVLLVLAVCLAPVLASYGLYYGVKPRGAVTNYGELIIPQRPVPASLTVRDEQGGKRALSTLPELQGKWWMVSAGATDCDGRCLQRLYYMRQIRVAQGQARFRIETLWLRTDDQPVSEAIIRAYPDMVILSVAGLEGGPEQSAKRRVAGSGADSAEIGTSLSKDSAAQGLSAWLSPERRDDWETGLYLVDPNGHLMMRFPPNPDPGAMKRDVAKLLKWSGIG
jgi:cytochrome oxidase Cu insertion factor (SCO1/SenC/PrrC family)